jgi:hypothetical protein
VKFDKKAITQWVSHRCERQLGLSLWTDAEQRDDAASDEGLGIPHRQIFPGLQQMARQGDEWQALKAADLMTAFGAANVVGCADPAIEMNAPGDYRSVTFANTDLADHLDTAAAGQFIVEAAFEVLNPVFRDAWQLGWCDDVGLRWADARPDIIEVAEPGSALEAVTSTGATERVDPGDTRLVLRVIDAKLSSEPGRGYYAEVAYYSVALAAWIASTGRSTRFVVDARPSLWPGSHEDSELRAAWRSGASLQELIEALDADLEPCPMGVFLPEIRRFFLDKLPRVAAAVAQPTWTDELAWHVVQSCSGCDYLGEPPPEGSSSDGASSAHPNHCMPDAAAADHMSRLPYVPRGGTTVLASLGVATTEEVAALDENDVRLDEHHSLRAGRRIIPTRARTLAGAETPGLGDLDASTAAVPAWSDLNLFITADFDPSSAITGAFGLSAFYAQSNADRTAGVPAPPRLSTTVYLTSERSVAAEAEQLDAFLETIDQQLSAARAVNNDATVQLFIWDELTMKHLTRVIGRHLPRLVARGTEQRLTWLFPPEDQVLGNARLVATPTISVVGDAVRSLVATDQAHAYTLLETARRYHDPSFEERWLATPSFWTTRLSDQLPAERIFELWNGTGRATLPLTRLIENLNWTTRARHSALQTVVRRLRNDLRGRLHRKAPMIRNLGAPERPSATSFLGCLLVCFSKLNHAVSLAENQRTRAMAPHEREARFASIRCLRRLRRDDEVAAAERLGLSVTPGRWFYEMAPGSAEVKAEVGNFGFCVVPAGDPAIVYRSLGALIDREGLGTEPWWTSRPPWLRYPTWEKGLEVTIAGIDRGRNLVAIEPSYATMLAGLSRRGLVDLDGECTIDPVQTDFATKKIADAARAVGNPAAATANENELREALGATTRGPRRTTAALAVHDLLWNPDTLHATRVRTIPTDLRDQVEASLTASGAPSLNADQWEAWRHALEHRLTLIWGPPGTGKSRTLGGILDGFVADARSSGRRCRILVTAHTWAAVDNVLGPFVERNPDVVAFRPNPSYRPMPTGPLERVAFDVTDQDLLSDMVDTLDTLGGPVVVGCTSAQAQKIIAATTGEAAGDVFDVIVVDEAGQIDVGTALVALAGLAGAGHVVVAGDPLQLPPIVAVEPPDALSWMVGPLYNYFAVGYEVPSNDLLINYRSNAEIVALSKLAGYPDGFTSFDPTKRLEVTDRGDGPPDGWPESIDWNPAFHRVTDAERPIVCLTYPEGVAGQWNLFEADLTRALVALLADQVVHQGEDRDEWMWGRGIGVVTPHRAQRARIVDGLADAFDVDRSLVDSAVDTVERFQGQERHVIVASYAVGDPDTIAQEEEFLQNLNRFNVLATRPMSKLIVAVTDELVGHLASDIDTLRSSALIKQFATTYCDATEVIDVSYSDPHGRSRTVELSVRWPAA